MTRRSHARPVLAGVLAVMAMIAMLAWWALGPGQAPEDADRDPADGTSGGASVAGTADRAGSGLPPAAMRIDDAAEVAPIPRETPASPAAPAPAPAPARGPTGTLVVDATWPDGRPAADVGLRVTVWDPADPHPARLRGRTDAAGRFERDAVPALTVTVHADRGGSVIGEVAPSARTRLALKLPAGLAVVGHVRDGDGRPVGGASIWLLETREPGTATLATRSDAQGRFQLAHVTSGRSVGATAPGYTPSAALTVRGKIDDMVSLALVLGPPGGALRGTVTDDAGAPIEGAAVRVSLRAATTPPPGNASRAVVSDGPPAERREAAWALVPLASDKQGRFTLDGVPAGPVMVRASVHGRAPLAVEADIAAGELTELTLALPPAALVRGSVRDATGRPLGGAAVTARGVRPPDDGGGGGEDDGKADGKADGDGQPMRVDDEGEVLAYSGPDGVYLLWGPPLGDVELTARFGPENRPHARVATMLRVDAGDDLTWDPVLDLGLRVDGRVVEADGEPAGRHDVVVSAEGLSPRRSWKGTTDGAGRFSLVELPGGPLSIEVHARDAGRALLAVAHDVVPGGGEVVIVLPADTGAPAGVRGRVVDEVGRPLPAAVVAMDHDMGLRIVPPSPESILAVDPGSGAFESGPLEPGRWKLDIAAPAADGSREHVRYWRTELLLEPGDRRDLGAIALPPNGTLHLRLGVPEGVSLGFRAVTFERLLSEGRTEPAAGAVFGTEATLPFPPGDYRLRTGGPGLAQRTVPFTVAAGETAELEVVLTQGTLVRIVAVLPDDAGDPAGLSLALLDTAGHPVHQTMVGMPDTPIDGHRAVQATFNAAPGVYRAQLLLPGRPVHETVMTVPALADALQTFVYRLD